MSNETQDRWRATIEAYARNEIGTLPSTIGVYMRLLYRDMFGEDVPYCTCSSRFRDAAIKIVAEWQKKKKKKTTKKVETDEAEG